MIKETTTTYAYKLQYIENLTFDKIRGFSKRFIDDLPKPLVDDLYSQLERGVVQIDSEPQMLVYLYAFGNMHQAKLNKAFENVPDVFLEQPEINIIDYGCGQAIGTMCYLDFIRQKCVSQKVKRVTLIEPSEICLKRAALHTSVFLPGAEILTVNKTFDELSEEDINCEESAPTLHILSNVLDLDFENFAELVKGRLQGYNQFVCVGPYFGFSEKDERFEEFCSLLDGKVNFHKFFDKYQLNPEKAWTAQIRCFSVGELEENLSTEVTDVDIENGVEDEFGVVYSRDGKRLLKCRKDLKNYIIKDGTKVICDDVFTFRSLQQITIPNSVTSIGDLAFYGCMSLRQIILPKSITSIGENPFPGCKRIEILSKSPRFIVTSDCLIDNVQHILISYFGHSSVDVPNSVTCIGDSAFRGCESLQQITIPNSVTSIGDGAFCGCKFLQQITIPNSITSIGDSAFDVCESLQQITIPNSVTSIGDLAFCGCESLRQITIPNSITSIGDSAFDGCESLQQITIPNSVTSIGDWAFGFCESLQEIILPKSITSIGENPFPGCKRIEILSKSPRFIVTSDCLIDNVQHILISYFGHSSVDVPNSVTCIGDSAFRGCESLQQITISNSVTSIGKAAFYVCKSLQQITIPNSVTSIGDDAFYGCESLQQITIPNSVTKIGDDAFCGCESLRQIIIPENSVEKFKKLLPKYLWDKLYYLVKAVNDDEQDVLSTKVTEEDITNGLEDDDGVVYSKDGKRLLKETCYTIYNEVSEMLRDEPYDIQLTDFLNINYSIKEGTKVICDRAFYHGWDYYNGEYISNLEEIHIPPTIKFIGEEAFLGCKLKTVIIPNSVTSIGQGAFMGCSLLQEITIPNSVINIGNDAFYGCNSLQQIIIPINSVEKFKKLLPKYLWDKFMINPDFPPPLPF